MDGYEQLPSEGIGTLQETVKMLGKQWAIPILVEIQQSPREKAGFRELQNRLDNISSKVLSERLKEMVEHDILKRRVNANLSPIRVNYRLTKKGNVACHVLNRLIECSMA
ncbi:MAG: helix-turn-helix domain-containing protein [Candidatus Altiarchaeota archaeon]